MGQALAVDLGLDERGHEVVAGVALAVGGELRRELRERPDRLAEDDDRLAPAADLRVLSR